MVIPISAAAYERKVDKRLEKLMEKRSGLVKRAKEKSDAAAAVLAEKEHQVTSELAARKSSAYHEAVAGLHTIEKRRQGGLKLIDTIIFKVKLLDTSGEVGKTIARSFEHRTMLFSTCYVVQ